MSVLRHWQVDPVVGLLAFVALWHAVGARRRMRALRAAGRDTRLWQLRGASFYAGLLMLALAIASPLDYLADRYLIAHMIQHIVLAFIAPPLVVLGAPWLAFQRALPRRGRQQVARVAQRGRRSTALGAAGRVLLHPATALVLFNGSMLVWHLPGPYDLAARNTVVHLLVEHTSFMLFGVLLWLQLLDSPPFRPRLGPLQRAGAAFATNAVMVGVAMTLVLFSHQLYPFYAHIPHTIMSAYSDQQVAGSALWICGEFTLAPTIYWNVQLFLRAQGDRRTGPPSRPAAVAPWARRASRWSSASPETVEMGWRQPRPSRTPTGTGKRGL